MAVSVSSLKLTTKASGAQLDLNVPNILGTCSMRATNIARPMQKVLRGKNAFVR